MKCDLLIETWGMDVTDEMIDEIMDLDLDWEMIQTDMYNSERVVLMGCSHLPKPLPSYMFVSEVYPCRS